MPTEAPYDVIIFDISNRYHAAFSTSQSMTSRLPDGAEIVTGGIYTLLRGIQKICRERLSPRGHVYYLADATVRASQSHQDEVPLSARKMIDPDYKANRAPHPNPSFYRGLELAYVILGYLRDRSHIVRCDGYEADDLVPAVIERHPNERVLLVSNDEDWCRSLSSSVDVLKRSHKLKKDIVFSIDSFIEENGYSPLGEGILIYKAFRGDSDNIPKAVKGILEVDLVRIINECKTLDGIKNRLSSLDWLSDAWKSHIMTAWPRIVLNHKLIDFMPIDVSTFSAGVFDCAFKPHALRAMYDSLGFNAQTLDPRVAGEEYARESSAPDDGNFFIRRRIERA